MKDYLSSTEGNLDLFRVTGAYEQKPVCFAMAIPDVPQQKHLSRGEQSGRPQF